MPEQPTVKEARRALDSEIQSLILATQEWEEAKHRAEAKAHWVEQQHWRVKEAITALEDAHKRAHAAPVPTPDETPQRARE
jgi:hypothetical protein